MVAGIGYIIGIWKFGWWSPLMKHQLNRFLVLFDSTIDRQGVGWNAWKAKIAIGNGGFFGQGIGYPPVFVDIGDHLLERTGTAGLPFLPPLLFFEAPGPLLFFVLSFSERL